MASSFTRNSSLNALHVTDSSDISASYAFRSDMYSANFAPTAAPEEGGALPEEIIGDALLPVASIFIR